MTYSVITAAVGFSSQRVTFGIGGLILGLGVLVMLMSLSGVRLAYLQRAGKLIGGRVEERRRKPRYSPGTLVMYDGRIRRVVSVRYEATLWVYDIT